MANHRKGKRRPLLWLLFAGVGLCLGLVRAMSTYDIGGILFPKEKIYSNPTALPPEPQITSQRGKLSDGSTVILKSVSFGTFHRIPGCYDKVPYFRTAAPTVMFTFWRRAAVGALMKPFCCVAYVDDHGKEYPLRRRFERRALYGNDIELNAAYEGSAPVETWETWEFRAPPPAETPVRVRVFLTSFFGDYTPPSRSKTNLIWPFPSPVRDPASYVEFTLPNSLQWRVQSIQQQTRGFDLQKWLDQEIIHAPDWYVKDLLAQGANVDAVDETGRTALSYACDYYDYPELINVLLSHGADVNAGSIQPLMLAAENGEERVVRILLDHGANPDTRVQKGERAGWDATMFAASACYRNVVDVLVARGAKTDPQIIHKLLSEACSPPKRH